MSDFFRRFGFEAFGPSTPVEPARACHCFRPTDPAIREDVEVNILVDAASDIIDVSLGLDRRAIVTPCDECSARDIAASFLAWAIRAPPPYVRDLIAGIAGTQANDPTGGYAVFVGAQAWTAFRADTFILCFENQDGALPPRFGVPRDAPSRQTGEKVERRWLRLDIHDRSGAGANDKAPLYFKIMRSPTQCVLWTRPELVETADFFSVEKKLADGSHLERTVFACRECGQKYFYEWYEEVDWDDGSDKMYSTFVPVDTDAEIAELEAASVFDLMTYYPRIHAEGGASWMVLGDNPKQNKQDRT